MSTNRTLLERRPAGDARDAFLAERSAELLRRLLAGYRGPVGVRLWDGRWPVGAPGAPATLVVQHPGALRELLLHGDLVRFGEAYLGGALDVEGDMETLFDLVEHLRRQDWSLRRRLALAWQAWRLPRHEGAAEGCGPCRVHDNSATAIRHHYDVGNDFYGLWLDAERVYSCAYFRDEAQALDEAQRDKLDYICRKLRLAPGQRLLDIGCGWGALAIWAARHYGARVHGITLSQAQCDFARERVAREGLQDRVSIELRDYRELPPEPAYDRVVSVGMFEHIGVRNFPRYFGLVRKLLRPGGLFLNHGITNDTGWVDTPITRFVNAYVFPDGELAQVSTVQTEMERAGFEILDVESLRRHYALTLRAWVRNLEARWAEAVASTSEATARLWRLYMAGSAYFFNEGSTGVYQILAGRLYDRPSVPLRRDDLYRP